MSKQLLYILPVTVLLFVVAFAYDWFFYKPAELSHYQTLIQAELQKREQLANQIIHDTSLFRKLEATPLNRQQVKIPTEIEKLFDYPLTILWFQNQKLTFWNQNAVQIDKKTLEFIESGEQAIPILLSNGLYEIFHKTNQVDQVKNQLIVAIALKNQYPLKSPYLNNHILGLKNVPGTIRLQSASTAFPIANIQGQVIQYLSIVGTTGKLGNPILSMILYLLAFIALGILINYIAKYLVKKKGSWLGAGFLLGSVIGFRYLSGFYNPGYNFERFKLFTPGIHSIMGYSLGDFLINSILLLWMMVFFHREFKTPRLLKLSSNNQFALTVFNFFLMIAGLFALIGLFKQLVVHSNITFDFDSVFNLDIYSFLAIVGAIFSSISLFLFSHRMMLTIANINLSRHWRVLALVVATGLCLLLPPFWQLSISWLQLLLVAFVYGTLFDLFIDSRLPGLTWLVVWLFLFSAFISMLLFKFSLQKDLINRIAFAESLSQSRDTIAEKALINLGEELTSNAEIKNYFENIFPSHFNLSLLKQQLDPYFTANDYLFNNYNFDAYIIPKKLEDANVTTWLTGQSINAFEAFRSARPIADTKLYFLEPGTDRYSYFWQTELSNSDQEIQQFLIAINQKHLDASRVYTELFPSMDFRDLTGLNKYDYAVYRNKKVILSNGKPQQILLTPLPQLEQGTWKEFFTSQRSDIIYQGDNNTIVLIGKNLGGYLKPISLFSFLFVLFIVTVVILYFFNALVGALPSTLNFHFFGKPSLRNKIQLSVIALILGSFILIGLVTVAFFQSSSNDYHENRLTRKISAVLKDLEYQIGSLSSQAQNDLDMTKMTNEVADIHNMDVNIYHLDGQLQASSANFVFENKIIAPWMNARAYYTLSKGYQNTIVQDERIEKLNYRAAYVPLRNSQEETIAYLGLPYYSKGRNLRSDVYEFMGTLLNVYVFLLLMAGVLAIAVANSITKPISRIGEELRRFKLGRNQPLEWKSQDELGQLIAEYNRMIDKLEESAERLKQSEREGAWREMAKQVAHEIKNPLTPMKLSIQYLIHAYKSNPKNVEPLLSKVSNTLIEQIDGLSRIASEFSNFAQMPKAQNETFVLNDLVRSIFNLYNKNPEENLEIKLTLPEEQYAVFADKDHLMRVFNNLVKNAIQAIPDERIGVIDISMYKDQSMVVVQVSDNGTGISEQMQERVFYPNFTTKNSGMGLGLAISKNIIDTIDGEIYFNTKEGIGTDFFVKLPIQSNAYHTATL